MPEVRGGGREKRPHAPEVRGGSRKCQAVTVQERGRGGTPFLCSGAAAGRRYMGVPSSALPPSLLQPT